MSRGTRAIGNSRSKKVVVIGDAFVEMYLLVAKYKLWAVDETPVIPDEQAELVAIKEDSFQSFGGNLLNARFLDGFAIGKTRIISYFICYYIETQHEVSCPEDEMNLKSILLTNMKITAAQKKVRDRYILMSADELGKSFLKHEAVAALKEVIASLVEISQDIDPAINPDDLDKRDVVMYLAEYQTELCARDVDAKTWEQEEAEWAQDEVIDSKIS